MAHLPNARDSREEAEKGSLRRIEFAGVAEPINAFLQRRNRRLGLADRPHRRHAPFSPFRFEFELRHGAVAIRVNASFTLAS